jgi:hypothetical protein
MDTELITEIAIERLLSNLCVKWYLEEDEEKKKVIYDNELLPFYKKINKIEILGLQFKDETR